MSEHVLMTNSVDPPLTLFQELVEVPLFYLIKSTQMTFRLVPEILNTVVMILLVSEEFWMIHSPMMKTRDVECILGLEAVFSIHYWQESSFPGLSEKGFRSWHLEWWRCRPCLPSWAAQRRRLYHLHTTASFPLSSETTLIYLDFSKQFKTRLLVSY